MDEEFLTDMTLPEEEILADEGPGEEESAATAEDSALVEATSNEYLGRWNHLISTTNWEKGRIICEWRTALIEGGAPAPCATDDAWARRVGNVTPQHAGRLRRVYQQFGSKRDSFRGLYWSHFQAALDWDDADMWLEGAVQNGWSIVQMQGARARTLGALEQPPTVEPAAELDEDATPPDPDRPPESISGTLAEVRDAEPAEARASDDPVFSGEEAPFDAAEPGADEPAVRPFENLPALPADVRDAFEAFKLVIVHHRLSHWQEISCDDMLAVLDSLRHLAEAPL
jgi:hypothetical protein